MSEPFKQSEWRHGWPMVAAGVVGMTLCGFHTGVLGTVVKPLSDTFGWNRAEISSAMMINTILLMLATPVAALLIPTFGARRLAVLCTLLYATGLLALGFCTPNILTWYFGWSILGIAMSGVSALVWSTMITQVFAESRGRALSVALSGSGIATLIVPLIAASSLERFGLRAPFFILAGVTVVIILPLLIFFMRLRPDFGPQRDRVRPAARRKGMDFTILREISGRIVLWQLIAISCLTALAIGMIFAHMQPILRDGGATATQAAFYFAIVGPTMIGARLFSGVLIDRYPTHLVASGLFLLPGATCGLLLINDGSPMLGISAAVVFGLGFGAELNVLSYMTAKYFEPRQFPLAYSLVYGLFALGCGVAAMIGGASYDRFGSYHPILWVLLGCIASAIIITLSLGGRKGTPMREGEPLVVADPTPI
jgi:predicted MFS family arabinose efflux permease